MTLIQLPGFPFVLICRSQLARVCRVTVSIQCGWLACRGISEIFGWDGGGRATAHSLSVVNELLPPWSWSEHRGPDGLPSLALCWATLCSVPVLFLSRHFSSWCALWDLAGTHMSSRMSQTDLEQWFATKEDSHRPPLWLQTLAMPGDTPGCPNGGLYCSASYSAHRPWQERIIQPTSFILLLKNPDLEYLQSFLWSCILGKDHWIKVNISIHKSHNVIPLHT